MHPLEKIVQQHKSGKQNGIYSVCSAPNNKRQLITSAG